MRSNRPNSIIHTLLFILLCIALAVLASVATFRRGRTAKSSYSGQAPGTTAGGRPAARWDGSDETSFRSRRAI
jgi:hypothetical protein